MKKIIISILVINLLLTISIVSVNAAPNQSQESSTTIMNTTGGKRIGLLMESSPQQKDVKALEAVLCSVGWNENNIQKITDYSFTRENIIEKFLWLENQATIQDTVLITIGAHGTNGYFVLDGNEGNMYYTELNSLINNVEAKEIAIVLNICHSGSAIPDLQAENRVIMTSCQADETAGGFMKRFCFSIQGFSDYEGDNNDFVSIEESYNYILNENLNGKHPQLDGDGASELIIGTVDSSFLDTNHIDIYHNHPYSGGDGGDYQAQSFKPNYNKLTKAKFLLCLNSNVDLYFSIRSQLNGVDLTSKTVPAELFSNPDGSVYRFIEVDFPDIDVIPGETYYFVWYSSTMYGYTLGKTKGDDYADGVTYYAYKEDHIWREMDDFDYLFITYSDNINHPPEIPSISGPASGDAGEEYDYTFSTTDPDDDKVYYFIDWDDGNTTKTDLIASGTSLTVNHTWSETGTYHIKAKAVDIHGAQSDWGYLEVTMPYNYYQSSQQQSTQQQLQSLSSQQQISQLQQSPYISSPINIK